MRDQPTSGSMCTYRDQWLTLHVPCTFADSGNHSIAYVTTTGAVQWNCKATSEAAHVVAAALGQATCRMAWRKHIRDSAPLIALRRQRYESQKPDDLIAIRKRILVKYISRVLETNLVDHAVIFARRLSWRLRAEDALTMSLRIGLGTDASCFCFWGRTLDTGMDVANCVEKQQATIEGLAVVDLQMAACLPRIIRAFNAFADVANVLMMQTPYTYVLPRWLPRR